MFTANTSMIHSVFVKSYLMPDRKKDFKRKTEEIRVESSDTHVQSKGSNLSVQHVYSPSSFKFTKALEYSSINKDMIKGSSVQLELCLTQKYSKKSFLVGLFHMKLKDAVKKMVREKYPLIPCMNHTIPAHMRVYCASELKITNSKKIFYSNPDVRNLSDTMSTCSSRATSNPDVKAVELDIESELSPIKLDLSLIQDSVSEGMSKEREAGKKPATELPGLTDLDFDRAETIQSGEGELLSRVVDITDYGDEREPKKKSAFSSVIKSKLVPKKKTEIQNIASSQQHSLELDDRLSPRYVEEWKYRNVKEFKKGAQETKINIPDKHSVRQEKVKFKDDKSDGQGSRPETPTWDFYDFDYEPIDITIEDVSPTTDGAQPIYLPMETMMGIKGQNTKSHHKGHRKQSKRKIDKPIPGRAVPQIVISDAELDKIITSSSQDFVTPRNVTIDMSNNSESTADSSEKMSRSQIKVTADVHVPRKENTTIEIKDSDSFVIDLEDIDSLTPSSKLGSKLTKANIPMQVFIDENYDSYDEGSIAGDIEKPNTNLASKNHDLITEV